MKAGTSYAWLYHRLDSSEAPKSHSHTADFQIKGLPHVWSVLLNSDHVQTPSNSPVSPAHHSSIHHCNTDATFDCLNGSYNSNSDTLVCERTSDCFHSSLIQSDWCPLCEIVLIVIFCRQTIFSRVSWVCNYVDSQWKISMWSTMKTGSCIEAGLIRCQCSTDTNMDTYSSTSSKYFTFFIPELISSHVVILNIFSRRGFPVNEWISHLKAA